MFTPRSAEYTLYDTVTPVAITSSTDATPIVITATSHSLVTGDTVFISGHTTNVAANGFRRVTVVTANTFQLQDPYTGANIAGSGAGAGASGVVMKSAKVILVSDFKTAVLSFVTAGTATLTMKIAGSTGKLTADAGSGEDAPNFGGTLTDTNFYNFLSYTDLDAVASGLQTVTAGATGFAVAGTDFNKTVRIDVSGLKYLALIPTAFTQGSVTAKLRLFVD